MIAELKKKKLYIKLLVFFIGLAIFIVLALSAVFQNIYQDALLEEMYTTYEHELRNRSIEIEKLIEEVDYTYLSVLSNREVTRFMAMDSWNPMDEYDVKQQFTRFRNIHAKIHSLYLYNGTLGYVVTTDSAGSNLSDFSDKEVFRDLSARKHVRVREIAPISDKLPSGQVVSFIYSQFNNKDRLESCVVINITNLADLGMLGQSDLAITFLMNERKDLLTSNTDNIPTGGNLWDELGSESGSYIGTDDQGIKYLISYCPVPTLNWTLVSIHDYSTIMTSIQSKTAVILYLALGILLISGTAIVFLTRNYYLPIEKFVHKVGKANLGLKDNRQRKHELDYLMASFNEMIDKVNLTQQSHDQVLEDSRKDFYRRALTLIQESEEVHTQAERYGIDIQRNWFCSFVVKLDQYYSIAPENRVLHKTAIRQIVEGQLGGKIEAVVVSMRGGMVAAILFSDDPIYEKDLLGIFQSISTMAENTIGQSITIGLGRLVDDFEEVRISYDEALALSEWRLTLGYGKILTTSTVPSAEQSNYPDDLEKQMLHSLRIGLQSEYQEAVEQLTVRLQQYAPAPAKLYLTQIMMVLIHSTSQIDESGALTADLSKLADFLANLETLTQAREWFENYFQKYTTSAKEISLRKNSKKMENIINQAMVYLDEHCKDTSLSIETVATHFGYTANYFSKIFKDCTGQFINDYIRECRIKQAKILLEETALTVNEVAELTGYTNTNYFFYAFKKTTGMTPSSYRTNSRKKEISKV